MNQRTGFGFGVLTLTLAACLVAACSGGGTKCGDGTVAVGGTCEPAVNQCGPGTVAQGGECVPACADGETWNGTGCEAVPTCAAGTVFDPDRGDCVPACGDGEYWDGAACATVPTCGAGTTFDPVLGACVPTADACAPGTSLVDGRCVADLECAAGSHIEDGECVPDRLGDPDVPENPDDTQPADFGLPAAGQTITLGGDLDQPEDKNGDGNLNPDWDAFRFTAEAGTWLRIRAESEGATLPAYTVDYLGELADDGGLMWRRVALAPETHACEREVYLPYAGEYWIWFSDYNHVAAFVFNYATVPVGGEDFTYQISVENLGAPQPQAIGLPHADSADVSDGALAFYEISGLAAGDLVELTARPVKPEGLTDADVYPALVLVDSNGQLLDIYTSLNGTWESSALLHQAQAGQSLMVVRDFYVTLGPQPLIDFAARSLVPTDCDAVDCSTVTVTDEQSLLLTWDLAEGDFFVAGSYFGPEDYTMIHQQLFDDDLNPLSEEQYVYPAADGYGAVYAYAEHPMSVWLWMRWGDADPVGELETEAVIHSTEEVRPGYTETDLPVYEFPPGTLYPAGVTHFSGHGGKVLFFTQLTTHGAGWVQPTDLIMTPGMVEMAPIVDTNAWNFPDGKVTPTFTYIKDDGHKLYYVYDSSGDPTGGTYDVQVSSRNPEVLGRVDVGAPLERNLKAPTGLDFYTFEAGRNQYVEITVDGVLASDIQPEIWVMNFGAVVWDWIFYRWVADPDAPGMGLVVSEKAPAAFEPFTAGYVSPYDGMSLLLIMDAGGNAGPLDLYNLTLSVPPPPANDACVDAEPISLAGGTAHVDGTNLTATDRVSEPACTGGLSTGPEVYYSLQLSGGDTVEIVMDSEEIGAAVYLFTDCGDVEGSCVAGSDSGTPETFTYQVPADAGGTYFIGADSNGQGGSFTLDVTVTGQ